MPTRCAKTPQRWLQRVADSDKNLGRTFRAAVCSGEGLDAPTKVNTSLSLCECHKCHFQPLNVKEAVEVTANTADWRDTLVPIGNIPERSLFFFFNIKEKKKSSSATRQIKKKEKGWRWRVDVGCWLAGSSAILARFSMLPHGTGRFSIDLFFC